VISVGAENPPDSLNNSSCCMGLANGGGVNS
jgi:hypothetical protein